MKNILLIGGAGFLGSNLASHFLFGNKYNVFVMQPDSSTCFRLEKFGSQISVLRADIRDTVSVERCLVDNDIDIVLHLASSLKPHSSLEDYQIEYSKIIFPSMNLASICSKLNILLVLMSSGGAIYGNSSNRHHVESDGLLPISFYGLSKCNLEEAIQFEHRRSGLRYLILRPSNPYGIGQNLYGSQGLVAVALGNILKERPIRIWGNGEALRDYIYVDDLCIYLQELLDREVINEIVNIGSAVGTSVNSIVKTIFDVVETKVEIDYIPSRHCDVDSSVLNIDRLLELVRHRDTVSLEDGISRFVEYELACLAKY